MTMKFTMKKFHLVSKYANYLTWDEKQNAPSLVYWVYNGWNAHVIPINLMNLKKAAILQPFFLKTISMLEILKSTHL